jgi:hypothetical protein
MIWGSLGSGAGASALCQRCVGRCWSADRGALQQGGAARQSFWVDCLPVLNKS